MDNLFQTPEDIRMATRGSRHPLYGRETINPWTGGRFIFGVDSHKKQYHEAVAALAARDKFAVENPSLSRVLPLTQADCDEMRWGIGATLLDFAIGMFARSWMHNDHRPDHPSYGDYVAGLLISEYCADVIKERWSDQYDRLALQYPPKPLNSMGPGCIWKPSTAKRTR